MNAPTEPVPCSHADDGRAIMRVARLVLATAALLFFAWWLDATCIRTRRPDHPMRLFFLGLYFGVMPFGVLALHMLVRSGSMPRRLLCALVTTLGAYVIAAVAMNAVYAVPMSGDLRSGVVLHFSLEGLRDHR